jgi:HAD superfamily hydrolase (TIGR01549 family)
MEASIAKEKDIKKPSIILMDLGKVILFPKEDLAGKMNSRHKELLETQGEDYPFFDYFGVNEGLLDLLEDLKERYQIYMITEGKIQNHPPLRKRLERVFNYNNIFSTGERGLDKKTPEAYEYVVKKLGVDPEEVLFVDDSSTNIQAASQVGLQTIQSISKDQSTSALKAIFLG